MLKYQDLTEFFEEMSPFGEDGVVEMLNARFGEAFGLSTTVRVDNGIVSFESSVSFKLDNPNYDPDKDGHGSWSYPHDHLERTGVYVAPTTTPYFVGVTRGVDRSVLNALYQFGAKVLNPMEATTPPPAPPASAAKAPARSFAKANGNGETCEDCGQAIPDPAYVSAKGNPISLEYHLDLTQREYGKDLCKKCSNKRYGMAQKAMGR